MAHKIDPKFGEEVVKRGLVSKTAFEAAVKASGKKGGTVIGALIKDNIASEEELYSVLSDVTGLKLVELREIEVDKQIISKVPIKMATYYHMVPISQVARTMTVAVAYPLEVRTLDDIRLQLGYDIELVLSTYTEVAETIKRFYGVGADTIQKIISAAPVDTGKTKVKVSEEKIDDLEKAAGDVSVIRLVNQIILEAYKKRATDIHIEPYRDKVNFRYRIDGMLYDANVPDEVKNFLLPILSRIKIMSNLNIVERRLPQDGRAIVKVQDKTLDLRVSFIPTPFGESVVIRVLPTTMFFDLVKLGLSKGHLKLFESFISKPHGIIFVTGPTGSGKTTTLYACLSKINSSDRKIITIEDPIEYEMSGITQIQVNNEIGLDFARGLRSMLRHDPDVMMVGEVRDLETAEIAIRVALTGHLVFSTLHTNDAASGVTRLLDIGVEPFLVHSSVLAFVAQRLVRKICPNCKKEDKTGYSEEFRQMMARDMGLDSADKVKIFRAVGCKECNGTGYYGRTAIYEILTVNTEIQEMIMNKASVTDIRRAAIRNGMRTLRQDGWTNVMNGVTTPEEVLRVSQKEEGVETGSNIFAAVVPEEEKPEEAGALPGETDDDRRVYKRIDDRINIRYKSLKKDKKGGLFSSKEQPQEQMGATNNISAGGLKFSTDNPPKPESVIDITLEMPLREEPIRCHARIVRVETIEAKKEYSVCVEFLDLSGKDRADLDRYVGKES